MKIRLLFVSFLFMATTSLIFAAAEQMPRRKVPPIGTLQELSDCPREVIAEYLGESDLVSLAKAAHSEFFINYWAESPIESVVLRDYAATRPGAQAISINPFSMINSVAISPNGHIFFGSQDGFIEIWKITKWLSSFQSGLKDVQAMAISPDGNRVAFGSNDGSIRVWDIESLREVRAFQGHSSQVLAIQFSPDGKMLMSGARNGAIRWGNVETGEETEKNSSCLNFGAAAFSPDGTLFVAGYNNTILIFDSKGEIKDSFRRHVGAIRSVAFSPNGRFLASGSADGGIWLWDLITNEHTLLRDHSLSVDALAFSRDSQLLASRSRDRTIKIWDIWRAEVINKLVGHSSDVSCVAFSPLGGSIVSGSCDQTVRLWKPKLPKESLPAETNWLSKIWGYFF